jgi:hypothetical protein
MRMRKLSAMVLLFVLALITVFRLLEQERIEPPYHHPGGCLGPKK